MEREVGCHFEFDLPARTHGVLLIEPHRSEQARVTSAVLDFGEGVTAVAYVDAYDHRARRITAGPRRIDIRFSALVDVAWAQFGAFESGWAQVQAVGDWVHEQIEYDCARWSPSYSAASVLEGRVGVCRDFTHLGIGLCRALNLPARYVFGYLPDIGVPDPRSPMDFCAWMDAYLGDRWYTFDPRNNRRPIGRVVIGRGRDAADVAMVTTFGRAELITMIVVAELADRDAEAVQKSNVDTAVTVD
jgi:transglutaminase-like putative cysteine protease